MFLESLKTAVCSLVGNVHLSLSSEEKPFVNRLYDLVNNVERNHLPRFTTFLNEREQVIAEALLPTFSCKGRMSGGFTGAQRKMLALYPSYYKFSDTEFPFDALCVVHLPEEELSHRDVLGSLIGLGLARESIGDILPQKGKCDFIVAEPTLPVVLENLKRVGRTGVRCQKSDMNTLESVTTFVSRRGTVSSLRLDALVSMLTGQSRQRSSELIQSELVQKNYSIENRTSCSFEEEDIITVRGYGKYIVDTIGTPTRKNRLPVECRKYQ